MSIHSRRRRLIRKLAFAAGAGIIAGSTYLATRDNHPIVLPSPSITRNNSTSHSAIPLPDSMKKEESQRQPSIARKKVLRDSISKKWVPFSRHVKKMLRHYYRDVPPETKLTFNRVWSSKSGFDWKYVVASGDLIELQSCQTSIRSKPRPIFVMYNSSGKFRYALLDKSHNKKNSQWLVFDFNVKDFFVQSIYRPAWK
ncbi:MAG: hypothetical protein V1776_01465 [Candidatus Diapherotrites archaeon]